MSRIRERDNRYRANQDTELGADFIQSDWDEEDDRKEGYIRNKPEIPDGPVQSDWDEGDSGSMSYIRNKPDIILPERSDWEEDDEGSLAYILNKPDLSGSVLEEDVISMVSVGGVGPDDLIPEGSTITDLVKQIFLTTFYPSFTSPTLGFSNNLGFSSCEVGLITSYTLSAVLGRGSIIGALIGGIWYPSAIQGYRIGAATKYYFNGVDNGLATQRSFYDYQFVLGNNVFSTQVYYSEGPQPLDSDNKPYMSPAPAGYISSSTIIAGKRSSFWDSIFWAFKTYSNFWAQSGDGYRITLREEGDWRSHFPVGTEIRLSLGMINPHLYPCDRIIQSVTYGSPYAGRTTIRLSVPQPGSCIVLSKYRPSLSDEVRTLSGSALGHSNGSSFTINIAQGTEAVVFAYPSSLRDVSSVIYVEGFNAEIKDVFGSPQIVSVAGANSYSPTNYKVYTMIPDEPFSGAATYIVTI